MEVFCTSGFSANTVVSPKVSNFSTGFNFSNFTFLERNDGVSRELTISIFLDYNTKISILYVNFTTQIFLFFVFWKRGENIRELEIFTFFREILDLNAVFVHKFRSICIEIFFKMYSATSWESVLRDFITLVTLLQSYILEVYAQAFLVMDKFWHPAAQSPSDWIEDANWAWAESCIKRLRAEFFFFFF